MKSSSSPPPSVASISMTTPLPRPLPTTPPPPDLKGEEFLPERDNSGASSSSSSPASPRCDIRPARLSLSSPELLSELKASRSRSLRHVPAHNGLTTVFSGRGGGQVRPDRDRQVSGPAPSGRPANQRSSQ